MRRELLAREYEELGSEFLELEEWINRYKEAKGINNKVERNKAKEECEKICELLVEKDPHYSRLYFKALNIDDEWIFDAWKKLLPQASTIKRDIEYLPAFQYKIPDLNIFPPGSWFICFRFSLRKPYLSQDDADFYIIENPVKREWVFNVPYVAPSQWKGCLRASLRALKGYLNIEQEKGDEQMIRLFGNAKDEDLSEESFAGSLFFYPAFFDQISLEVINPHDRETGAGRVPVWMESVPPGAESIFNLLYVPLNENESDNAKKDLELVTDSIWFMVTEYGFGAKVSSGFGTADILLDTVQVFPNKWEELVRKRLKGEDA